MGTPFVPGAELGRRFYAEVVRPLLDEAFPGLPYAAAHLGNGSDVLGYDTAMSRDHDWGPSVTLFLPEAGPAGRRRSGRCWPTGCRRPSWATDGFATHPGHPDVDVMTLGGHDRVRTTTVRAFARQQLDWDPAGPLGAADWLSFPSQQLLRSPAGRCTTTAPVS